MRGPFMLLFARDADPAVELLRARAPGYVRQVSIADLSRPGWRYAAGRPDEACAVAEGAMIASRDIGAVLCRIPGVAAAELADIQAVDRDYVAAETHAFLLAWLTQFRGLRFNAPTPWSLCGPGWREAKWMQAAARAGLPVAPGRRADARAQSPGADTPAAKAEQAIVVAGQVLGTGSGELAMHAERLARACDLGILGVRFVLHGERWIFAGADPCPALDGPCAAAVLRIVENAGERPRWAA